MTAERLEQYLQAHGIEYIAVDHAGAYTASHVAQMAHISGREMAKSVIVKAQDGLVMAVVPANMLVDLEALGTMVGLRHLELASEREFTHLFADCAIGALPPFGNVYGLEVYVDAALTETHQLAFKACSHDRVFKVRYRDFANHVRPHIGHFATTEPH